MSDLEPCADCSHAAIHLPTLGCLGGDGTCTCRVHVPPRPVVVSSPTLGSARAERDAAMVQVAEHTDPEWELAAVGAITWCATNRPEGFTSDDVWQRLADLQVRAPHEPRALGPIVKRAVKAGAIEWTGGYTASARRRTAPVRVYVRQHQ